MSCVEIKPDKLWMKQCSSEKEAADVGYKGLSYCGAKLQLELRISYWREWKGEASSVVDSFGLINLDAVFLC